MEPNQNILIAGSVDECSICLEPITNKAFSKDCLHNFCYQCIYNWVQQRPVCPLCLKPIKAIESNLNDIYYLKINDENDSHPGNSNNEDGENEEVSDSENSDNLDDEFEYDDDSETFSDDTDDECYYDDVDSPDEDNDYFMNVFRNYN